MKKYIDTIDDIKYSNSRNKLEELFELGEKSIISGEKIDSQLLSKYKDFYNYLRNATFDKNNFTFGETTSKMLFMLSYLYREVIGTKCVLHSGSNIFTKPIFKIIQFCFIIFEFV